MSVKHRSSLPDGHWGVLKHIAEAGLYSATYYETSGWRGVLERQSGSPMPEKFHSLPNSVFPLYHVLADIGELSGGDVLPVTSSDPFRVEGLAVCKGTHVRILLANLTGEKQEVTVRNLSQAVWLKTLDEINAYEAMTSPERYRQEEGVTTHTTGGILKLELLPYAVVRVDNTRMQ